MEFRVEELEASLEKKRGQVKKAKTLLDTKRKKNQRLADRRKKYGLLISDAEEQIKKHERLVEFHREQLENWKELELSVPDEVVPATEEAKYKKVSRELEEMETIASEIKSTLRILEQRREGAGQEDSTYTELEWEAISEVYRDRIDEAYRKFKSAKGPGF